MIDALVADGDIVILRPAKTAGDGEMVAVWLKNEREITLKFFYREEGKIHLQPANPQFPTLLLNPSDVEIQGKVIAVIRRLK